MSGPLNPRRRSRSSSRGDGSAGNLIRQDATRAGVAVQIRDLFLSCLRASRAKLVFRGNPHTRVDERLYQ